MNYIKSKNDNGRWMVIAMDGGLYKGFAIVETEEMADIIIADADNPEIIWEY